MNGVHCTDRALFKKCMEGATEVFKNLEELQVKTIEGLKEFQDSLGTNIGSAVAILESMTQSLTSAQANFAELCASTDIMLDKVDAAQEEKVF